MSSITERAGWRAVLMTSVSAVALSVGAPVVMAQDTPAPAPAEEAPADKPIEKVTVTGTRLKKDEFTSPSPVQIIDPRKAEKAGSVDTASTIQGSSLAKGSAQITSAISSAFVTNGGPGTATISLRGLGAERTLVLLNGRRAGPAGIRGAVGAFDLNVIPQSVIQSVEILKDGASSVYGSDAVAGVVNIITRKDMEGFQFDGFYSQPFEEGAEEERYTASWGTTFGGGHVQASVDYYKRNELTRGQRDYLGCPEDYVTNTAGQRIDNIDPRTGKYHCDDLPWGHIWVYDYSYIYGPAATNLPGPGDGTAFLPLLMQFNYAGDNLAGHGIPSLASFPAIDPAQVAGPAGWFPVGYDPLTAGVENDMHPFVNDVSVIPETERFTLFLEGAYQVADAIEVFGEFMFNRRETYQNGYRQFWQFGLTSSTNFGPGDPFAVGWTGDALISPTSVTDWSDTGQKVDYYRAMGGARGEFGAALAGWEWDFYSQYSRSSGEYYTQQILNDVIATQDFRTASCVGTFTPISNRPCIDLPWVDPEFLRGNLTPAQRAFLFDDETGKTVYTQLSAEASVTGTLFDLWAGPVDVAMGATWRKDEINDVPGEITLANNAWGNTGAGITKGEATTTEYFAEGDIPLLADVPFAKLFNVRLSGRYTSVDTVGDGDETYKVGANWQVNDFLRFRGTYGTSFRAPHLFELFLADQTSFLGQRQVDPCIQWGTALANGGISQQVADNCAADGIPDNHSGAGVSLTVITGGGLGLLKPETSTAKTLSVVLTPDEFMPKGTKVSLAIDYFEIEVEGEITQLGANNIVGGCYASDFFPNDPLCDLFTRGQTGAPNNINTVRDSFINIATQLNRGIDVTGLVRQELPSGWGDLSLQAQMTWQFEDKIALFADTAVSTNGEDGEPIWVGNFNVEWTLGEWSVFWGIDAVQHTSDIADFVDANGSTCTPSALYNELVCRDLIAESKVYHALSVTREWEDWRVTAGVANIFDEEPPRVSVTNLGEITTIGQTPFTSNYDFVGRRGFLSVSKKF